MGPGSEDGSKVDKTGKCYSTEVVQRRRSKRGKRQTTQPRTTEINKERAPKGIKYYVKCVT